MTDIKPIEERLVSLIVQGSTEALRDFLRSGEAKENRARLHTAAQKLHKEANAFRMVREGDTFRYVSGHPTDVAERAFVAMVLTSTAAQFKNTKWGGRDAFEIDIELAKQLSPDCLAPCLESLLEHNPRAYSRVREIVSAGLCSRPQTEQYAIGLIAFKAHHEHRDITLNALRNSPEILNEDIWLLFETEGTGDISLAAIDKYSSPGNTWGDVLYILQKEGLLPRERLLKASLEALGRGFIQFRAGWFSRFHESLKPTPAERSLLIEEYGKLLASNIQPTVSFALAAWLEIEKHQAIPSDMIFRYLPPCLSSQTKNTVLSAISLLEKTSKRNPEFRRPSCEIALEAITHQSSDVQEKLLKFLSAHKDLIDDEIRCTINRHIETLAPSLQDGFRKLAGVAEVNQSEATEQYEMLPEAWELFSLGNPIMTLDTPEDFINLCLSILEKEFNPLAVESILLSVAVGKVEALRNILNSDGDKTLAKSARALVKRLHKAVTQASGFQKGLDYFFNLFLLHFLGAQNELAEPGGNVKTYFEQLTEVALEKAPINRLIKNFTNKFLGILERSGRGHFIPLGLPAYDSGYINTDDLLQQAISAAETNCYYTETEPYSAVVRLPWNMQEVAFASLNGLKSPGKFAAECTKILAELIQTRSSFDKQEPASIDLATIRALEESNDYTLAAMAKIPALTSYDSVFIRLSFCEYPIFSEQFHSEGAKACKRAVRWFEVSDLSRQEYFRPLAMGFAPYKERAHFLLAVGCLISAPEIVSIVSDCLISSIEERKLNVALIGEKLGLLLHSEISMPKRVANILGQIAQISSLHSDAVRQIIEQSLARDPKDSEIGTPRDLGALLEVLVSCSHKTRRSISNPATRTYLSALKAGSKSAKLAKELLALG